MKVCPPCPFLPKVDHIWRASEMTQFRDKRDGDFYLAALSFAQSLLMEGKPAQGLLQINKSFLADLSDSQVLAQFPPGYQAKRWIFEQRWHEEQFLGNPVRHYQHLASRMSGPRAEIRSWRAWGCFHLAEMLLPAMPRDEEQIAKEKLVIPSLTEVLAALDRRGWKGEADVLRGTLLSHGSSSGSHFNLPKDGSGLGRANPEIRRPRITP